MTIHWVETEAGRGELVDRGGRTLAVYDHSGRANHPSFMAVQALPHAGVLTNHAPWDHRWHHGLWWSWKFIDDILFWEDHEAYGGNRAGLGRSVVTSHEALDATDGVTIREELEWRADRTGERLLRETRVLTAHADDAEGLWWIDWDLTWTADRPVELDVTPFPEHAWGGYAGLNYRAARSMVADERIQASNGRLGADAIHGSDATWVSYSGNVDGSGADEPGKPAYGGVLLIDHVENAWANSAYVFSAEREFGFAAMAPLMHGNRRIDQHEPLRLRYRTVIFGERLDQDHLDRSAEAYRRGTHSAGAPTAPTAERQCQ